VSKEAPKVLPKVTPTVVEVEESKVDSDSEDGEIIDVVQTMRAKKAEVSQQIINEKVETAMKVVEPEEVVVKV
jgi:hypothetical protein